MSEASKKLQDAALDKLHEECGIFGGYSFDSEIAPIIKDGLSKLQHRGQESAGICVGANFQTLYKKCGLVKDVFENLPTTLTGSFGIGHVRYSTQGKSDVVNAQPMLVNNISIAHNGNIQNTLEIKNQLISQGETFETESDTEIILKTIIREVDDFSFEKIGKCLAEKFSQGAYSLVVFLPQKVLAYRDAFGFRPLFFCKAEEGFFVASEDVAFEKLNVKEIIEIQAGFGVEITGESYNIKRFAERIKEKKCVFEPIYFSSPKSNVFGLEIGLARQKLGEILAINDNIQADYVVSVPNSGNEAAKGYSKISNIPLANALSLNENSGRSFILPNQNERVDKVKNKFTVDKNLVNGKKLILIDDSIVRGTTSKEVIKMLRLAGAKEIHFRLSSPKLINLCFWGVDIPKHEELFALRRTEVEMSLELGADSVKFLEFDDLKRFFGEDGWCYNCFIAKELEKQCDQRMKIQVSV